ncbi:MAG: ankyrin repeat domain-containing protein [Planctomycetes bacterium]|nr:ankyrin repeat domain-containing protein [Planctomycetota bacterium]
MRRPGLLASCLLIGMVLVTAAAIVSQRDRRHPGPFEAARQGQAGHLSYHLRRGLDPDQRDPEGRSLLDLALGEDGNFECVALLIRSGASVNGACGEETPLGRAVAMGRLRDAKLLLDAGADPNAADPRGRRPLHRVRGERQSAMLVMTLVKAGADLEAQDGSGLSAREHLQRLGDPAIDRLLAERRP